MKTNHPSCKDVDALLHKHLIAPASIWTVLLLAACVAAWFESAEVRPVVPATAQAAVQGSDSL